MGSVFRPCARSGSGAFEVASDSPVEEVLLHQLLDLRWIIGQRILQNSVGDDASADLQQLLAPRAWSLHKGP